MCTFSVKLTLIICCVLSISYFLLEIKKEKLKFNMSVEVIIIHDHHDKKNVKARCEKHIVDKGRIFMIR